MGRLTVRLPQTLHEQLVQLAEQEGISLNQYILYALARQAAVSESAASAAQQQAACTALRRQLGKASPSEVQVVLAEREPVEPEAGLPLSVIQRMQAQIAAKKRIEIR
jgi:hypothetical protein